METNFKNSPAFFLYTLLLIGVSGCATQPYVLNTQLVNKAVVEAESAEDTARKQKLNTQAIKVVDEFNTAKFCLINKEKLAGITSWEKIAYVSATLSGAASLGTSAAVAGAFGAFSGVSKYMGDNNEYSKARNAIEPLFNSSIEKYYKAIDSQDYTTAGEQLDFASLIIHKNRLDCSI